MFELDQKVVVITGKGIAYEGFILARGKADDDSGAYKIGLEGAGFEQPGQWHKACDVFLEEPTMEKEPYSSEPSWNDSPR